MYLNKKYIFGLLIIVTITTTSVFGGNKKKKVIYVNVGDYHTCLPLLFRPQHTAAVPNQTIQLFGETFTATRHHIIPYNTLATFFNLVLREDPVSELGVYLARRVFDIWNFFKENDGAGAYTPDREQRVLSCDSMISATFNVDNRMLAAFTWMPGNMFYGPPAERCVNDPVEFEEDAERIVGREAFAVLSSINFNMQNYINNLSERTTTNFDTILNDLSVVAERNTLYEFYQTDWVEAGWDEAGNKLFGIKTPTGVIKGIKYGNYQKIKNRWGKIGIVGVCEDYMKAADRVCEEYTSHLVPKLNTNFTHVDIDSNKLPLFVYSINNKHFVYGQNKRTNDWSVHAVEQDGMVGALIDQGSWGKYYAVQFAYEIDGKHYFYGHDLETNFWFIHELKANGTIGRETDHGYFGHSYQTQFYIYVNGQHCLYGQNDHKHWFLQILNSDGTMGRALFFKGTWNNYYNIQFPFKIGDRQYIAGFNTDSRLHYIREIGADNLESMGKPNVFTTLDRSYSVLFPVSLGGKTYLFGHTPKNWAVRQVFGDVVEENVINYEFTNLAQPFNINGYQYFYARHKGASNWSLHYFDYKYFEDDVDN